MMSSPRSCELERSGRKVRRREMGNTGRICIGGRSPGTAHRKTAKRPREVEWTEAVVAEVTSRIGGARPLEKQDV